LQTDSFSCHVLPPKRNSRSLPTRPLSFRVSSSFSTSGFSPSKFPPDPPSLSGFPLRSFLCMSFFAPYVFHVETSRIHCRESVAIFFGCRRFFKTPQPLGSVLLSEVQLPFQAGCSHVARTTGLVFPLLNTWRKQSFVPISPRGI